MSFAQRSRLRHECERLLRFARLVDLICNESLAGSRGEERAKPPKEKLQHATAAYRILPFLCPGLGFPAGGGHARLHCRSCAEHRSCRRRREMQGAEGCRCEIGMLHTRFAEVETTGASAGKERHRERERERMQYETCGKKLLVHFGE